MTEFIAVENERMIPQQAVSMITNADDMERYIKSKETQEKKYLGAIDLPLSERRRVLSELGYMGITAGLWVPEILARQALRVSFTHHMHNSVLLLWPAGGKSTHSSLVEQRSRRRLTPRATA
jgi:hypothetical protein